MSQILCWNYAFSASLFPESVVNCEHQDKILNYLTPTSIIVFDHEILTQTSIRDFLLVIKLVYPLCRLIAVNGKEPSSFFEGVSYDELDHYISQLVKRKFEVENKKQSIIDALNILHPNIK